MSEIPDEAKMRVAGQLYAIGEAIAEIFPESKFLLVVYDPDAEEGKNFVYIGTGSGEQSLRVMAGVAKVMMADVGGEPSSAGLN